MRRIARGNIYWSRRSSFTQVLHSVFGELDNKLVLKEFEAKFASIIGVDHCVAFPHARIALREILKALGARPGDVIVLPPITIKGILEVVLEMGLSPIFCELDIDTCSFDLKALKLVFDTHPRFVLITPLFGLPCDVVEMCRLAGEASCEVLIDFSQGLNTYVGEKQIGSFGAAAIYSSSSIKTLDTLGGGLAVYKDLKLDNKLRASASSLPEASRTKLLKVAIRNLIRNLATTGFLNEIFIRIIVPVYGRYRPQEILRQTGTRKPQLTIPLPTKWSKRYSSVQASIGLSKMKSLETEDQMRVKSATFIRQNISNDLITLPTVSNERRTSFWQLVVFVQKPEQLQKHLRKHGIDSGATSLSFLPDLISDNKNPLQSYRIEIEQLQNARKIYFNSLFVPCYPALTEQECKRIVAALNTYRG